MISLLVALVLSAAPSQDVLEPGALEQLERVYQQSCAERSYGSYNEICDQMRAEIRSYRRAFVLKNRASRIRQEGTTGAGTAPIAGPVTPATASAMRPGLREPPETAAPQR